jgi:hypothetical protein
VSDLRRPSSVTRVGLICAVAACAPTLALTLLGGVAGAKPKRHHGCGVFCQQAGPPAGDATFIRPVELFGRVLHVRNGAVKIEVKCILKKRCVGSIGVWDGALAYKPNYFGRLGAVNMSIPAGKRTRITVPFASKPLALIARRRSGSVHGRIWAFTGGHCHKVGRYEECDQAGQWDRLVRVTLH